MRSPRLFTISVSLTHLKDDAFGRLYGFLGERNVVVCEELPTSHLGELYPYDTVALLG